MFTERISPEDRMKKWLNHFQKLLGQEPNIGDENPNEGLPTILQDLGIYDGDFSLDELKRVKKYLREGKASGPDDIPPEVLKRCDLDDIILRCANKLMNENMKPEQW